MTEARRSDDSRIDEILRTVGHIDTSIRDHERRINENEKVLIRVQAEAKAAATLAEQQNMAIHADISGLSDTVHAFANDFRGHTAQESRDRRALLIAIVMGVSAFVADRWFI